MKKLLFLVLVFACASSALTVSEIILAKQLANSEKKKPGMCAELAAALDEFADTEKCKYISGKDFDDRDAEWVSCESSKLKLLKDGNMHARTSYEGTWIDVRVEGSTCVWAIAGDMELAFFSQITKSQKKKIQNEASKVVEMHRKKAN